MLADSADSLFISLGSNCYVSWTLRKIGLQNFSYPLDWVNTFRFRLGLKFIQDFTPNLASKFVESPVISDKGRSNIHYLQEYMIRLPHEYDLNPNSTIEEISEKYQRRLERLREHCSGARHVIFIRSMAHRCYNLQPEGLGDYEYGTLNNIDRILKDICNGDHFTILLLYEDEAFSGLKQLESLPRLAVAYNEVPFENGFFSLNKDLPVGTDAFSVFSNALKPLLFSSSTEEVRVRLNGVLTKKF